MRITKDQLQSLINEEVSRIFLRRENRTLIKKQAKFLKEAYEDEINNREILISMDDMIDFAKAYASLSRDDRKNLDYILDGRGEGVMPEEIQDLQRALGGHHQDLDSMLSDALEASAMYMDEEDDGTWIAAARLNR